MLPQRFRGFKILASLENEIALDNAFVTCIKASAKFVVPRDRIRHHVLLGYF